MYICIVTPSRNNAKSYAVQVREHNGAEFLVPAASRKGAQSLVKLMGYTPQSVTYLKG